MRKRLVTVAALAAALSLSACIVVETPPRERQGPSGPTVQFELVNGSSQYIHYIYVSPADDPNWGPDILEIDVLAPGESVLLDLEAGTWDIKCVGSDGAETIMRDEVISKDLRVTVQDEARDAASNISVDVVNRSGQSIYYIYVSPATNSTWGPDILELDTLEPGETTSVWIQPGVWDIKCVKEDGEDVVLRKQRITNGSVVPVQ